MGAPRDGVGHVVTDALAFPRELVDRFTNTAARLLVLFGGSPAKAPRGIRCSLAKLCDRPGDEPHRQACADERARHQSDQEAAVSALFHLSVHGFDTPASYVTRKATASGVHNGIDVRVFVTHAEWAREPIMTDSGTREPS
jgi:hypothetical protein